jgi:hypothetical protein
MILKTLFPLVLAVILVGIGIRLASAPNTSGAISQRVEERAD